MSDYIEYGEINITSFDNLTLQDIELRRVNPSSDIEDEEALKNEDLPVKFLFCH